MSLVIETFIICDVCCENFGIDMRHLNGSQQRASAKVNGWLYSGNKDYCPSCRAKRKDGQNHAGIDRKSKH
jgi:hypothetical protein